MQKIAAKPSAIDSAQAFDPEIVQCPTSPTHRHWDILPETDSGGDADTEIGTCKYCGRARPYHRRSVLPAVSARQQLD